MAGVDQLQVEPGVLQHIPRGPPVRPGRLHRDMRDPLGGQPVPHGLQGVEIGLEGADLLLAAAAGMRTADAGDDHRLADVKRCAALMDDVHDDPLTVG